MEPMSAVAVALGVAFLISLIWSALATRIGPALGFVDSPDGDWLKTHDRPAVPLGGIGILGATHVGLIVIDRFDWGLFAATAVVVTLGLADDRYQLSPRTRLAFEAVAGLVLVSSEATPLEISDPLDVIVGVALVVLCINAVNLFDGLDGLAGATALVTAVGLAVLADSRGLSADWGAVFAAAIAGFLILNWHKARLFLGDNGAYLIGTLLAFGMMASSATAPGIDLLVSATTLGVFALDLIATVTRRRMSGKPLFVGDRSHLYDQLADRGWAIPGIALTSAVTQAGFMSAAIVIDRIDSVVLTVAAIVSVIGVLMLLLRSGGFLEHESAAAPT